MKRPTLRFVRPQSTAPRWLAPLSVAATLAGCTIITGEYEPCGDKACGDTCTICAPDDPDCIETAVLKVCDAAGECGAGSAPMCGGEETGTSSDGGSGDTGGYDACEGKTCGDPCSVCPPDDPECVETGEEKACDPSGACVADDGTLCGDGDGDSSGDGDGACSPITTDPSGVGMDCIDGMDCPAGYVCQGFSGIVFTQSCQVLCDQDCECPPTLTCMVTGDKSGSWQQCG